MRNRSVRSQLWEQQLRSKRWRKMGLLRLDLNSLVLLLLWHMIELMMVIAMLLPH
jgi:hypothetical protein